MRHPGKQNRMVAAIESALQTAFKIHQGIFDAGGAIQARFEVFRRQSVCTFLGIAGGMPLLILG
jgi:hypothetical protein